jgi:hypothetical protein
MLMILGLSLDSGSTITGLVGPAYTVTTTTTATRYVTGAVAPGICSTLYAHGDNLPTTAAAPCGIVLIVNGAPGAGQIGSLGIAAAAGLTLIDGLAGILEWIGLM